MEKGYIHIYTGNGKGKTTAALGLSVRAACAGKKVFMGQFIKGMEYSELKLPEYFSNIVIEQFGRGCFIRNKPTQEDSKAAKKGYERGLAVLESGEYDVVIFDEIFIGLFFELFTEDDIIKLIDKKPVQTELILTGRKATQNLIDRADLVTEMKEIKHYYQKGVIARKGIEF